MLAQNMPKTHLELLTGFGTLLAVTTAEPTNITTRIKKSVIYRTPENRKNVPSDSFQDHDFFKADVFA